MRFGIIGLGEIANKAHIPAIKKLGGRISAGCDIDYKKLFEFADKYKAIALFDYRSLIKNSNVDIVSICTPNNLHVDMAIYALNAGKKVILEKPIGISEEQVMELVNHKLVDNVAVCYQRRFNTNAQLIKKNADKIKSIDAQILVRRDDPYWNTWRRDKKQSGGANLRNIDIHFIDLIQWWLGDKYKIIFSKIAEREGIDQVIYADFDFGGIPVTFLGSSIHSKRDIRLDVHMKDGTTINYGEEDGTHYDVYNQFVNKNNKISVQEALKSLKIVDALYKNG